AARAEGQGIPEARALARRPGRGGEGTGLHSAATRGRRGGAQEAGLKDRPLLRRPWLLVGNTQGWAPAIPGPLFFVEVHNGPRRARAGQSRDPPIQENLVKIAALALVAAVATVAHAQTQSED